MIIESCVHNAPVNHVKVCELCTDKPLIFAWLNGGSSEWYRCMSMSEDGEVLAGHVCSHENFAPHDLGVTSNWKHEEYIKKYPDGFRITYVPYAEVKNYAPIQEAFKRNKERQHEDSDKPIPAP
jgi:hypothetical protein